MTKNYKKKLLRLAKKVRQSYEQHPSDHICDQCSSKVYQLISFIEALEDNQ